MFEIMIVDAKFPIELSGDKYDEYLEQGYFRGASSMYRTEMLCIGKKLCGVINIRLPLKDHSFSKSQRKLISKNDKRFNVELKPFIYCQEKERLYQKFKHKFKGFLYPNLMDFLSFDLDKSSVYNTHMLEIRDENKLVGFSLFDLGKNSIGSLLAVYDLDFAAHSFGMYSLLKEIQYGMENGYKYVYPGYVLSNNKEFDYKLKMGKIEYRDWQAGWSNSIEKANFNILVDEIQQKLKAVTDLLELNGYSYTLQYYPNFSLGYIMPIPFLIKEPMFIRLKDQTHLNQIIYYDHKRHKYLLGIISTIESFSSHDKVELSEEYQEIEDIEVDIRACEVLLASKYSPKEIVDQLKNSVRVLT